MKGFTLEMGLILIKSSGFTLAKHVWDVLNAPVLIERSNCFSFTVNIYLSVESLLNQYSRFSFSVLAWVDRCLQGMLLIFVFCNVSDNHDYDASLDFLKSKDDEHSHLKYKPSIMFKTGEGEI